MKDALSKGYLDKCLLEIYRKKKGGTYEINELYTFHVRYTEEGAELYLSQSGSSSQSVTAQTMKNDTKQVLTTLVDMTRGVSFAALALRFELALLTCITFQLGPLPVARMVTMRLLYNEKAPDDYEAPGFLATKEHERLMMRSEPKKMSCGTLSTPHHEADLFVLLNEEAKKQEKSETEEDPDDIFKDLPGIEDDPVTQRHKQLSMKRKTIENSDDDDFMDVPPARVAKPTKLPARKNSGTAKARKSSTSKKRKVNNMSGVDDGALRAEVKSNPRGSGQVQRKLRGGSSKRGGASRTRNSARNGEHAPSQAPTVTLWRAIPTDGAEGIVQERIFQD